MNAAIDEIPPLNVISGWLENPVVEGRSDSDAVPRICFNEDGVFVFKKFHELPESPAYDLRIELSNGQVGVVEVKPSSEQCFPRAIVIRPPNPERFILLSKFEGVIVDRSDESFTARLRENRQECEYTIAEIDLEELSEDQRPLAIVGARVVWTIGYSYEGSTRKRESFLYIRRFPKRSDADKQAAREITKALIRGLGWE